MPTDIAFSNAKTHSVMMTYDAMLIIISLRLTVEPEAVFMFATLFNVGYDGGIRYTGGVSRTESKRFVLESRVTSARPSGATIICANLR